MKDEAAPRAVTSHPYTHTPIHDFYHSIAASRAFGGDSMSGGELFPQSGGLQPPWHHTGSP